MTINRGAFVGRALRALLGSRASQQMFVRVRAGAEENFPDRWFDYGPPSTRFAECYSVANHARALDQKEARNLRGKAEAATPLHSLVAV